MESKNSPLKAEEKWDEGREDTTPFVLQAIEDQRDFLDYRQAFPMYVLVDEEDVPKEVFKFLENYRKWYNARPVYETGTLSPL